MRPFIIICILLFLPVLGSSTEITKFTGSYMMSANDPFSQGILECNLGNNKEIICEGEQTVNPMGGTMKSRYRVFKLNKNGKGNYEQTWQSLSRGGDVLQDGNDKGIAIFSSKGVAFGKVRYKKTNR